jgi:hypothetical protein
MGRKSHVSAFLGIVGGLIILVPGVCLLVLCFLADHTNPPYQPYNPYNFFIMNDIIASFCLICGGIATGAGIIGLVGGLIANDQPNLAGFLELLAAIALILSTMLLLIPIGGSLLLWIFWLLAILIWTGPLLAGGSLALISDYL